jgi:hypothetical protein
MAILISLFILLSGNFKPSAPTAFGSFGRPEDKAETARIERLKLLGGGRLCL